jgi:two-component system OmpR family response regulator
MLPGGSGLDILRFLKQDKKVDGVIIISARGALEDKIEGLQLGADDYLIKPFHLSELSVRISAIIRRKNFNGQTVHQRRRHTDRYCR